MEIRHSIPYLVTQGDDTRDNGEYELPPRIRRMVQELGIDALDRAQVSESLGRTQASDT